MPVKQRVRDLRMVRKSVKRFPACAKHSNGLSALLDASAGEGRSEKIMRKQRI
jgi:hypothetical protein